MIKIIILLFISMFTLANCSSMPTKLPDKVVVVPASDVAIDYKYKECGVQLTLLPGWKLTRDIKGHYHAEKDDIDIFIDGVEVKSLDEVWEKEKAEVERIAVKPLKGGRVEKKEVNSLKALTIYHMSTDKDLSVDMDAVQCPNGSFALAFYTFSPVSSYTKDRKAVVDLVNTVKKY